MIVRIMLLLNQRKQIKIEIKFINKTDNKRIKVNTHIMKQNYKSCVNIFYIKKEKYLNLQIFLFFYVVFIIN